MPFKRDAFCYITWFSKVLAPQLPRTRLFLEGNERLIALKGETYSKTRTPNSACGVLSP